MYARGFLRAGLAVACLAAAIASFMVYVADVRLREAFLGLEQHQDYARALRDFRASRSPLDPSWFRDTSIAVGLLHTGHPARAEAAIVKAVRREPLNAVVWVALTRLQVARKQVGAARVSWERARRLNPHIPRALPPSY
ncbi:MAG: hypothetical protein E6G53_13180 [Actinobacteria bacterium]|nr:MAG: hypothetical protein E6G53_13180 [Actinomycetota bacterium]